MRHHMKYFSGHVGLKINHFPFLYFYVFGMGTRKNTYHAFLCIHHRIHACQAYDLCFLAPHHILLGTDPGYQPYIA